ncbi:amphi-Trp domain-containing protein [Bacillus kwashiorkori]|uniref:amphi-Trp domain-containing protein n=1 Tax=Bacillus kwashiorkori TaxID=1522318 RepID=UPI0009825193|nr:amphi-Trp domain-containing protein [Bacillus kwashiorkori]
MRENEQKHEQKSEQKPEQKQEKTKPIKQVKFENEESQCVHEFATMLETIARKLKEDGKFVIAHGEDEIIVSPTNELSVELEYEVKGDKHSFEIEFEWYEGKDKNKVRIL